MFELESKSEMTIVPPPVLMTVPPPPPPPPPPPVDVVFVELVVVVVVVVVPEISKETAVPAPLTKPSAPFQNMPKYWRVPSLLPLGRYSSRFLVSSMKKPSGWGVVCPVRRKPSSPVLKRTKVPLFVRDCRELMEFEDAGKVVDALGEASAELAGDEVMT